MFMKKNAWLFLILVSFVASGVGSVLKIKHSAGADFFLGVGLITFILGIGILIYKLLAKKSTG